MNNKNLQELAELLEVEIPDLMGEKGDTGERGERGDTGLRGEKGERGERGEKGDRGLTGEKGKDGVDGKDGNDAKLDISLVAKSILPMLPQPVDQTGEITIVKKELGKLRETLGYIQISGIRFLSQLFDVAIDTPTSGQVISWDATNNRWKNSTAGAGTPASAVTDETAYGVASAVGTSTNYARQDHTHGTVTTPTKTTVGLANVDNVSDANKPVSTATQTALNLKEGTITAGTTSQYYRGDKTFQVRDRTLFDHYVDVGNIDLGEDDLYSDTVTAATFVNNGDKVVSKTTGSFAGSGTATRQLRAYFAGTLIFDSGALSIAGNSDWRLEMVVIRVSNTVVRCSAALNTGGASTSVYTRYTEITALNLTTTAYVLKTTGTTAGVGAATNDIMVRMGFIQFINAA